MTLHYIRWRDACYHSDYRKPEDVGELEEVENAGFLIKETGDSVTISCERVQEGEEARLFLTIPKVNIVEWREFPLPTRAKKRRF